MKQDEKEELIKDLNLSLNERLENKSEENDCDDNKNYYDNSIIIMNNENINDESYKNKDNNINNNINSEYNFSKNKNVSIKQMYNENEFLKNKFHKYQNKYIKFKYKYKEIKSIFRLLNINNSNSNNEEEDILYKITNSKSNFTKNVNNLLQNKRKYDDTYLNINNDYDKEEIKIKDRKSSEVLSSSCLDNKNNLFDNQHYNFEMDNETTQQLLMNNDNNSEEEKEVLVTNKVKKKKITNSKNKNKNKDSKKNNETVITKDKKKRKLKELKSVVNELENKNESKLLDVDVDVDTLNKIKQKKNKKKQKSSKMTKKRNKNKDNILTLNNEQQQEEITTEDINKNKQQIVHIRPSTNNSKSNSNNNNNNESNLNLQQIDKNIFECLKEGIGIDEVANKLTSYERNNQLLEQIFSNSSNNSSNSNDNKLEICNVMKTVDIFYSNNKVDFFNEYVLSNLWILTSDNVNNICCNISTIEEITKILKMEMKPINNNNNNNNNQNQNENGDVYSIADKIDKNIYRNCNVLVLLVLVLYNKDKNKILKLVFELLNKVNINNYNENNNSKSINFNILKMITLFVDFVDIEQELLEQQHESMFVYQDISKFKLETNKIFVLYNYKHKILSYKTVYNIFKLFKTNNNNNEEYFSLFDQIFKEYFSAIDVTTNQEGEGERGEGSTEMSTTTNNFNNLYYLEMFQLLYYTVKLKSLEDVYNNIFQNALWNQFLCCNNLQNRSIIVFFISCLLQCFIDSDCSFENTVTQSLMNWIYSIFNPTVTSITLQERIYSLHGFVDICRTDKDSVIKIKPILQTILTNNNNNIEILPEDLKEKLIKYKII